jgi:hypothetical protein
MIFCKKKKCLNFEVFLNHDIYYDIDNLDLFSKLKVLTELKFYKQNKVIQLTR